MARRLATTTTIGTRYILSDMCGPSEEDSNAFDKDAPSFSAWKVPRNQRMKETIDMAREESMKQLAKVVE